MYICAKGIKTHLQKEIQRMNKKEIKEQILKEALEFLKYRKAYDENPCKTSEDTVNHMIEEDKYLSALE